MKTSCLSLFVLLATAAGAAEYGTARIIPTAKQTVYWQSIRTSSVTIPVEVPSYATSAELTISNLAGQVVGSQVFQSSGSYAWTVFSGAVPKKDDLFTLTLVTKNGSQVKKTETTTLALVRNAFAPVVLPTKETAGWGKAGDNLVLPYSDRWGSGALSATLSCKDTVASFSELSGEGWFGRALAKTEWRRDPVEAALIQGETTWEATVTRSASGLMLIIR